MKQKVIKTLFIIFIFFVQGCDKKMDHKPQDFFEGEQLDIAQLIYDGNEPVLKQKVASASKESLNRPAKEDITLLFWSILNAMYDNITPERLKIITDLVKPVQIPSSQGPRAAAAPLSLLCKGIKMYG